jgi:hypothetical protein
MYCTVQYCSVSRKKTIDQFVHFSRKTEGKDLLENWRQKKYEKMLRKLIKQEGERTV